jgi:hypothetical protein
MFCSQCHHHLSEVAKHTANVISEKSYLNFIKFIPKMLIIAGDMFEVNFYYDCEELVQKW